MFGRQKEAGIEKIMNTIAHKPAISVQNVLGGILSSVGELFATIAAAGAISRAVENRRQPLEADLVQLGLGGTKFNVTF